MIQVYFSTVINDWFILKLDILLFLKIFSMAYVPIHLHIQKIFIILLYLEIQEATKQKIPLFSFNLDNKWVEIDKNKKQNNQKPKYLTNNIQRREWIDGWIGW